MSTARALRRSLILVHRYLGITLGGLVVLWFASGIGMMYAGGMPGVDPELRLERAGELDLARVRVTPVDAAGRAGLEGRGGGPPPAPTLRMVEGRPAYRFGGRGRVTVFADTGEVMGELGPDDAVGAAARFMRVGSDQVRYDGLLREPDQWTLTVRGALPLHKVTIDDPAHTVLYVSPVTGDVEMQTTRASRALAWVAAIPHWLYFTPLRVRQQLWTRVILWTAGAGCVLALLGLVLGVWQFRFPRPFRFSGLRAGIPYRGWMRWHYITGLVFGVFTLTWVFSGLLSMEPFGWASGGGLGSGPMQRALAGGPLDPADFPPIDAESWAPISRSWEIYEIDYTRIQGMPYFAVRAIRRDGESGGNGDGESSERLLVDADTMAVRTEPFSTESLVALVERSYPETGIRDAELLDEYDAYYYARDRAAPLPVLRVRFEDEDRTWFYIDPAAGRFLGSVHRLGRVERWIYNGFHSLDFGFWYNSRPAWDIGVIALSLGGLATSAIGLALGLRRLFGFRRMAVGGPSGG